MSVMSGSTVFSPVAHARWFGQPAHDDVFPASALPVPGQLSFAFVGTSDMLCEFLNGNFWTNEFNSINDLNRPEIVKIMVWIDFIGLVTSVTLSQFFYQNI